MEIIEECLISFLMLEIIKQYSTSEDGVMNSDKDDIQANRMLEIARQHGLDTHLFYSDPPMCLIGTRASIDAFGKLLEHYEEMQHEIEELRDRLD